MPTPVCQVGYSGFVEAMRAAPRALRGAIVCVALVVLCIGVSFASRAGSPTDSRIEFVAENLFATANGTFHTWHVVSSQVSLDDLSAGTLEIEVDLASVDTDNERRDDHLRTADFFDVETYPVAKVRVHSAAAVGVDDQGRAKYTAKFDIDLHGVQKTLDGEFVVVAEAPLQVAGGLVVDRLDFGIGKPRSAWNPMSITEEIPVSFAATLP